MYSDDITTLPQSTTNAIDTRQREIANIRGVKFCWEITNNSIKPVYMNWAIVSPRTESLNQLSTTDFFRSDNTSRSQDFGTSLNSNEFHCLPINKDAYIIHKHKRWVIAPKIGATFYNNNSGKNYRNLSTYFKIVTGKQ